MAYRVVGGITRKAVLSSIHGRPNTCLAGCFTAPVQASASKRCPMWLSHPGSFRWNRKAHLRTLYAFGNPWLRLLVRRWPRERQKVAKRTRKACGRTPELRVNHCSAGNPATPWYAQKARGGVTHPDREPCRNTTTIGLRANNGLWFTSHFNAKERHWFSAAWLLLRSAGQANPSQFDSAEVPITAVTDRPMNLARGFVFEKHPCDSPPPPVRLNPKAHLRTLYSFGIWC